MRDAAAQVVVLYVREQRWRTLGWMALFATFCVAVVRGFRQAYPTAAERREFADLVADNVGFRVLNGLPHQLDTVGGFVAWRLSALAVFAAAWALLVTTHLLRGEEDAGRTELLSVGALTPRMLCASALVSAWIGLVGIAVVAAIVLVALGLPVSGTACFVLALLGPAAAWIGIGGITSQLATNRRQAATLAAALLGIALVARVIADGQDLDWLRWATPFGWYELVRPYGDEPRLLPMMLAAAFAALTTTACLVLAGRRDLNGALLERSDERRSHLHLLATPTQLLARWLVRPTIAWACGVWGFAAVLGILVEDVAGVLERSAGVRELLSQLVVSNIVVNQYLSIVLIFVCLLVSIHAVTHVAALMEEEASGRLNLLASLPVDRTRWLAGWVALSMFASALLLVGAATAIWAASLPRATDVELGDMLRGAANWFAAVVAFHGIGIALFGITPRRASGLAGALVLAAFTWWAVGSVIDVPGWTLWLDPFEQLAHVPAAQLDVPAIAAWASVGVVGYLVGAVALARRDLAPD